MVTWLAKQQLKKQKSSCEDYEVEKLGKKNPIFTTGDEFFTGEFDSKIEPI